MHLDRFLGQTHLHPDLAIAQTLRHQPKNMLLPCCKLINPLYGRRARGSCTLSIDFHLIAYEVGHLSVIIENGRHHNGVHKLAAVLAVVEQFDDLGCRCRNGLAKGGGMGGFCVRPSKDPAVATDELVFRISGQLLELTVRGDDGIVVGSGVGDD